MDQATFNRLLRRSYALPLVAMLLLAGVLLWQIAVLVNAIRWVQRTDTIASDARYLMRAVLDMETGLRGYLLTGDTSFLEPYRASEPTVGKTFDEIDRMLTDHAQKARVRDLREAFGTWHAYAQSMIDVRQHGGPYQSPELNLKGKALMDEIRAARDDFLQREESARTARVNRVQTQTRAVFISGTVLALALGLLLALYTRRQILDISRSYSNAVTLAQHSSEQLRENSEFISTALASIADGVIATDHEGRIAFMNRVAELATGWRWQDAAGLPLNDVFRIEHHTDMRDESSLLGHLLHERDSVVTDLQEHLLRGDERVPVEVSAAPIKHREGEVLGMVVTFRDITQRHQSEQALRSSERLAALGRLASSMAHEINNPLDALANLLYLLEHQSGLDSKGREQVKLASEELERITQIARNMLGFHRMMAQPIPVQLTDVLDTVLVLYSGRLHAAGVEAVKRYDVPGTVKAQPVEMRQIFANLIANAVDASPLGGRLVVHVRNGCDWRNPKTNGVRVFIADTGAGIAPQDQPRIMEAFFTTKGQRGNGLGLWVTRGIVEKYGGAIRFRSSTGQGHHGTVFSVFLPSDIAGRSEHPMPRRVPIAS
jgi:PAS domain S-box-containing protein